MSPVISWQISFRDAICRSSVANWPPTIKVRPGSGFYQFSCILGNMSCLCIHLVTLFNLPCKKKKFIEFFFYVLKYRFSIIPKWLFRWNYPCNAAHLHFFSRYFFAANFFLMLGGCYCRLPARMFIWLVVESISIWYVLYFTWYASTKYGLSLKAVFSIILFSHKFYFQRSFSHPFLDIQPWNFT